VDKTITERAENYFFSGQGNKSHKLGTGLFCTSESSNSS